MDSTNDEIYYTFLDPIGEGFQSSQIVDGSHHLGHEEKADRESQ